MQAAEHLLDADAHTPAFLMQAAEHLLDADAGVARSNQLVRA